MLHNVTQCNKYETAMKKSADYTPLNREPQVSEEFFNSVHDLLNLGSRAMHFSQSAKARLNSINFV